MHRAVHQPLRLIHEVRRNVDGARALDTHVEKPPRAPERCAVDQLLQVVDALELDGRPVGGERAEDAVGVDEPFHEPGRNVMAPGHHLHHQRPSAETGAKIGKVARVDEPGLVGEHVKARLVQPPDGACLAAVPAGEHDDVAAPLADQARERIAVADRHRSPARGSLGPAIEPFDQREEIPAFRAVRRVDEDLVGDARIRDAQRERGVKVPGVEKEQRVHCSNA